MTVFADSLRREVLPADSWLERKGAQIAQQLPFGLRFLEAPHSDDEDSSDAEMSTSIKFSQRSRANSLSIPERPEEEGCMQRLWDNVYGGEEEKEELKVLPSPLELDIRRSLKTQNVRRLLNHVEAIVGERARESWKFQPAPPLDLAARKAIRAKKLQEAREATHAPTVFRNKKEGFFRRPHFGLPFGWRRKATKAAGTPLSHHRAQVIA
mmetsp:Transcript_376/g.919  ORF Transcript_376/g.919 Transcript_376/m.919 type:complete len:210 (-) Transcript_376:463-1092(-)|eukprot:CAMPEP_0202037252 /NCGR_PEP_ID=MMETSP0962-20130828/2048_1 /ASSEMBLY_ACC=CAM_ASM_000488 /TAXON_ID=4773 /ORGANISM="Schizochytrium aggregatum, Strain ATCC28209" /LENGTH=209 /DNA_ID=CAMNT_0048601359 /DNA_START=100 /DNA_END=729 /DNA_ORIENTATION=-